MKESCEPYYFDNLYSELLSREETNIGVFWKELSCWLISVRIENICCGTMINDCAYKAYSIVNE